MRTIMSDLGEEANDGIKKVLLSYVMTSAEYVFSDTGRRSKTVLLDLVTATTMDKIYNIILKYNKTK